MELKVAFSIYRGNPRSGGQGVYTRYLTKALRDLGHAVTVFSGQPYPILAENIELVKLPSLDMYRSEDPFRWPRLREIESMTDFAEIGIRLFGGFPEPRTFSTRLARELKAQLRTFDVLHDNQSLGNAIAYVTKDHLPVVASVHHPIEVDREIDLALTTSIKDRLGKYRWYGFAAMQRTVANELERIITVSEHSKYDIMKYMAVKEKKITVIHPGVDTEVFYPREKTFKNQGQFIAVVSADVHLKGLAVLIEAMGYVVKENPEARLVVVGKPNPEGQSYKMLEKDSNLKRHIQFTHGISDEELANLYRESQVAVIPSLYEGFSLPAIQALASGLPVAATTGGALPEVLGESGQCALLVEPGNPGTLANAMLCLMQREDLREKLSAAGLQRVRENFTWLKTAEKVTEQYLYAMDQFNFYRQNR